MASLHKRGDVWYAKVYHPASPATETDPATKARNVWVRGWSDKPKTQAMADRLEAEKRAALKARGVALRGAPKDDSFAADVDAYVTHLDAKGDDPKHCAQVRLDLLSYLHCARVRKSDEVTRRSVDAWVVALRKPETSSLKDGTEVTRSYSRRTVSRHVDSLKAFLNWLAKEGSLPGSPLRGYRTPPVEGHEVRLRRPLTPDEQALLLTVERPRRDVYLFALRTGARRGQIAKLRVRDVTLAPGEAWADLKPKGHSEQRGKHRVPLVHDGVLAVLAERCKGKGPDELVFPDCPTTQQAAEWLRRDCEALGIDTDRVDFHALRHTFGHTLASRGVKPRVLQRLMGHADLDTTMRYYTHFTEADDREALALLA